MFASRLRPTFSHPIQTDSDSVFAALRSGFEAKPDEVQGQYRKLQAMVSIVKQKRHFWSPWLHLEIRNSEPIATVFGRFSPHPSIWTGFMFSYLALAVVAFFASILGSAQCLLSYYPWGFFLIPASGVLALVLWFASQAGQKLAWAEMEFMHQVVLDCLEIEHATLARDTTSAAVRSE